MIINSIDDGEEQQQTCSSSEKYKLSQVDMDAEIAYWRKVALTNPKSLEKLEILTRRTEVIATKAKRKSLAGMHAASLQREK